MSLPHPPHPRTALRGGLRGGRGARLAPDKTRPQAEGGMEQPPLRLKTQKIWRSSRERGEVRESRPLGRSPFSLTPEAWHLLLPPPTFLRGGWVWMRLK